jgi:hypothetical protein
VDRVIRCGICDQGEVKRDFLPLDVVVCSTGRIVPACWRCWLRWPNGHKYRVEWSQRCPRPSTANILQLLRETTT